MKKIQRALISVSDKTNLIDFAAFLSRMGVEILSTGGTAQALIASGLTVTQVSSYTGFDEILDGRVKTLHPKIHAGLLYRRDLASHQDQMDCLGFKPIDLLVVNLYPFEQTVAQANVSLSDAVENIDIGGPCLLRAAAKNYSAITAIYDPSDYEMVQKEIEAAGNTTESTRKKLAQKIFKRISQYDLTIANFLEAQEG
ncbi:MAG: IMP cyclohydrolase [Candidatus Adiutrix sp.]